MNNKHVTLLITTFTIVLGNAQNLLENGVFETGILNQGVQKWFLNEANGTNAVETAEVGQIYVSNTGNNSNSGSIERPYKTIAHAVSVADPGNTVVVRGGVYKEEVVFKSGTEQNPLVIKSYAGEEVIVDGRLPLTNWVNVGGNIWEASNSILVSRPTALTINDELKALARHPNAGTANSGYWVIDSHTDDFDAENPKSENFTITSSSLSNIKDWVGAEIVVRASHWRLDKAKVLAHAGNTVTFTPDNITNIRNEYGFFFQNTPEALDVDGEWCYLEDDKKIQIYSISDPNNLDIEVANIDYAFDLEDQSNITIVGIKFIGAKLAAIHMFNTENCTVRNCTFKKTGTYACIIGRRWNSTYTKNITLENNTFSETQSSAIEGGGVDITVTGNSFLDIGMVPGMGDSGNRYLGMHFYGVNFLLEKNRFERIGYMPVHLASSSNTRVNKNFVDGYTMILDDGAGIYFYTGKTGNISVNRTITNNIILNGVGAPEGTDGKHISTNGIYYDDNSADITAEGNTVAYNPGSGFYSHNSYECSTINNTIFACERGINFQTDDIHPADAVNNVVKQNKVISANLYETEYAFRYVHFRKNDSNEVRKAAMKVIGEVDNNYYFRPYTGDNLFYGVNKAYNYEDWKDFTSFELNTVLSSFEYDDFDVDAHVRFEYNASDAVKTIVADKNYITADGVTYKKDESIDISAYGSLVLIQDNSSLSVPDVNNTTTGFVYPNPASLELIVKGIEQDNNYSIRNVLGQKVLSGTIYDGKSINIENLKSGYYYLSIQGRNIKNVPFLKK